MLRKFPKKSGPNSGKKKSEKCAEIFQNTENNSENVLTTPKKSE